MSGLAGSGITNLPMVVPAPNLPPITKKMADHIIAGHFVDFVELPPAKGGSKLRPSVEGQVVLVQAAELYQSKRLITCGASALPYYTQQLYALVSQNTQLVCGLTWLT